jgi:nitrite reductase (NADH) small subunit
MNTDTPTDTAVASGAAPGAPAWTDICAADDIVPNTGVCAHVRDRHVAVFRLGTDRFYAIDNVDPKSGASVLSRGMVGNLGEHIVVASPLYKNHFDLRTGACLEDAALSVRAHAVRVEDGRVRVALA